MSSIKQKTGQCIDCEDGPDKPLIAGRCQFHYWKHRNKVKADADKCKEPDADKQAQQKALDLWYHNQIQQLPECCENCEAPLNRFAPWAAKAYIAHIVPKRNFESVKIHPLNRVFLCLICHTNYDNWSEAKVQKMAVIPICMERFAQFADAIATAEWRYLPDWLAYKTTMKAPEYYIGIDPDVKASGLAIWDTSVKHFTELSCEDLPDLCLTLTSMHAEYTVMVRLEAGWLSKGMNWHKGGYGSANKVGRNHEIGRQIEKYCIKHSIPYQLVKPLGYSSYDHKKFCMYTNWPITIRTNPETRVAGMLVYGW